MNRHFITAAALLATSPLLALAQQQAPGVQIYGQATAGVTQQNKVPGGSIKTMGNSQFAASLLGFRGLEDLGGGMSAVFRLEHGLNLDTGAATSAGKFWNRQSFVGLNFGPMATLTFGRQFHAGTDRVIQSLDVYNVGGTTLAVTPLALFGVNRFSSNDTRADDSIKLRLRGPAGLTAAASVGMDDGAGRSGSVEVAQVTPGYAVGAYTTRFKAPAIAANGTRPEHSVVALGGNYLLGPARLYTHYVRSEIDPSAVGRVVQKNKILHLGVDWQAAATTNVRLGYYGDSGTAVNGVVGRDGKKTTWVAQAEYGFSKRSSAHVGWFSNRFSGGYQLDAVNIAGLGRDPSASSTTGFTAGLRHNF